MFPNGELILAHLYISQGRIAAVVRKDSGHGLKAAEEINAAGLGQAFAVDGEAAVGSGYGRYILGTPQ